MSDEVSSVEEERFLLRWKSECQVEQNGFNRAMSLEL